MKHAVKMAVSNQVYNKPPKKRRMNTKRYIKKYREERAERQQYTL